MLEHMRSINKLLNERLIAERDEAVSQLSQLTKDRARLEQLANNPEADGTVDLVVLALNLNMIEQSINSVIRDIDAFLEKHPVE